MIVPGQQVLQTAQIVNGSRCVMPYPVKVIEVAADGKSLFATHDGWFYIYEQADDGAWVGGMLHRTRRASRSWYDRIIAAKAYVTRVTA